MRIIILLAMALLFAFMAVVCFRLAIADAEVQKPAEAKHVRVAETRVDGTIDWHSVALNRANQLTLTAATFPSMLFIRCGTGNIEIDLKTGVVRIPADVPVDAAAKDFWKAVAEAFPEIRKKMAESSRDEAVNEMRAQLDRIEAKLYVPLPASPYPTQNTSTK